MWLLFSTSQHAGCVLWMYQKFSKGRATSLFLAKLSKHARLPPNPYTVTTRTLVV